MKGKATEAERLKAVNAAVDECIRKGILRDLLSKNRAEVVEMSFWDYDAERHLRIEKEDSYEEGFQKGMESEKSNTLREKERADAAETRADTAEKKLAALQEELLRLRSKLAKTS